MECHLSKLKLLSLTRSTYPSGVAFLHLRYYVSDPGYGHASRAIALIRELKHLAPNLSVSVRTSIPATYIRSSLWSSGVEVTESANDIDLKFDRGLYCNLEHAYQENIKRFQNKIDSLLKEERHLHLRTPIDIIISDIAAFPFLFAHERDIPSVAVASFLWSWFLRELLGIEEITTRRVVERMDAFYGFADQGFALPFSCDLSSLGEVQRVPLLVRALSRSREMIRGSLGFTVEDYVIFLTGGFTLPWPTIISKLPDMVTDSKRIRFILSSNAPLSNSSSIKKIPAADVETQDYVAASDLVVSKPGHSIISEAVAYRVPLILTLPTRHPEWRSNLERLIAGDLATFVSFEEFNSFSWLRDIDERKESLQNQRRKQSAYSAKGAYEIASSLVETYDLS